MTGPLGTLIHLPPTSTPQQHVAAIRSTKPRNSFHAHIHRHSNN